MKKQVFAFLLAALAAALPAQSARIFSAPAARARPVAAVVAFDRRGVSASDADALTDLFAYDLTRLDRFIVSGRLESARIIGSLDMPALQSRSADYYAYVGDFLYADVVLSGTVSSGPKGAHCAVAAYDVAGKCLLGEASIDAKDAAGLVDRCQDLVDALLPSLPASFATSLSDKYEKALAPVRVRQRLLFVFPEAPFDASLAAARERMYLLFSASLKSEWILPFFLESTYDPSSPASLPASLASRYGAQRIVSIGRKGDAYTIDVKDSAGGTVASIAPSSVPEDLAAAIPYFEKALPPLPQAVVSRELKDMDAFNDRIGALMDGQRILSNRFAVTIGQKLLKTVGTPTFYPNFDLFSAEANFFWYYGGTLGLGAGYGFSIGYPGSIDARLSGHPAILQHELRIYPVAYRMPGKTGLLLNGFASIDEHNAVEVDRSSDGQLTFKGDYLTLYARVGAEVGCFIDLTDRTVLYLDALTLSYCIPIVSGPSFQGDRFFSGDVGGLGLLIRF